MFDLVIIGMLIVVVIMLYWDMRLHRKPETGPQSGQIRATNPYAKRHPKIVAFTEEKEAEIEELRENQ